MKAKCPAHGRPRRRSVTAVVSSLNGGLPMRAAEQPRRTDPGRGRGHDVTMRPGWGEGVMLWGLMRKHWLGVEAGRHGAYLRFQEAQLGCSKYATPPPPPLEGKQTLVLTTKSRVKRPPFAIQQIVCRTCATTVTI